MKTIKKYKHFLPVVVYGIFYLKCFQYLETHITKGYHLIHTPFDDMVPFCEFFVIPYFMWFGFIAWSVLYFGLCNKNRREYYQLIINLGIGMTRDLLSVPERPEPAPDGIPTGEHFHGSGQRPLSDRHTDQRIPKYSRI